MSDDNEAGAEESAQKNKQPGKVSETIDSITQLTKAVPIYQDAIQPVAKETGKALGTIGKAYTAVTGREWQAAIVKPAPRLF